MTWWQYMSLLFGQILTDMPADLVPFNQTYIHVHWKSKRKLTRQMSVHQTCQRIVWKFIRQDCCLVECLSRDLFCCYGCHIYACWPSVISATISRACWCDASLLAIPSDVVPHYKPCLLVWCLSICHAFWCDASLKAMWVWCLTIRHACWCVASL